MNKFTEKLAAIGSKMANQCHLQAVSYGMMIIMPLTIFGSIFQLISFHLFPNTQKQSAVLS